jgi:uncharacterized membrane-anchored protein YhcB (DUF1043 family)
MMSNKEFERFACIYWTIFGVAFLVGVALGVLNVAIEIKEEQASPKQIEDLEKVSTDD